MWWEERKDNRDSKPKIGLKQLDNILSGSLQVSGSGVTGSISTLVRVHSVRLFGQRFSGDGSQLTGITSLPHPL